MLAQAKQEQLELSCYFIVFNAVGKPVNIEYIDLPKHLAEKYQYFTEANLKQNKTAGYNLSVTSLEDGINDYVKNYLLKGVYLGQSRKDCHFNPDLAFRQTGLSAE